MPEVSVCGPPSTFAAAWIKSRLRHREASATLATRVTMTFHARIVGGENILRQRKPRRNTAKVDTRILGNMSKTKNPRRGTRPGAGLEAKAIGKLVKWEATPAVRMCAHLLTPPSIV